MTGVHIVRGIPQEFFDMAMGLKEKWLVDPERQPHSRVFFLVPYYNSNLLAGRCDGSLKIFSYFFKQLNVTDAMVSKYTFHHFIILLSYFISFFYFDLQRTLFFNFCY